MLLEDKRATLIQAILSLETEEEVSAFLDDLCTIRELEDLANRLHIASRLYRRDTFITVEREMKTSSATIARVNRCLKNGTGYATVLERLFGVGRRG